MNKAAAQVAMLLCQDWLAERRKLDRLLAECAATRHTPPANYWEAERKARRMMAIADVLAEELPDEA